VQHVLLGFDEPLHDFLGLCRHVKYNTIAFLFDYMHQHMLDEDLQWTIFHICEGARYNMGCVSRNHLMNFWRLQICYDKSYLTLCTIHYEKKGVLQLALQLNFWIASNISNSPYLHVVSVIEKITRVAKVATHCIYATTHYNSITTLSQQLLFNYYATPLSL
jgi:hypothetical protein